MAAFSRGPRESVITEFLLKNPEMKTPVINALITLVQSWLLLVKDKVGSVFLEKVSALSLYNIFFVLICFGHYSLTLAFCNYFSLQ